MISNISSFTVAAALGSWLLLHGWDAAAQPLMPPKTNWVVDSDELIRIELTNNLDVLISQVQVKIDQFQLNGVYGAYQPALALNATHAYNSVLGGYTNQTGVFIGSTVNQINSYSPGLTGVTPWGLSYNVTGPLSENNEVGAPDIYNSSPGVSLTQPLLKNLWIDNTRYQISLRKTALKTDQLALRNQIMTVINTLKIAYYNLIAARENVGAQEMAVKLAQETLHDDEQRVRAGSKRPLDEMQDASQAASARSDLLKAQGALAVQENAIKSALGLRGGDWIGITPVPAERLVAVPENPDVRECWHTALEKRPDMLEAKLKLELQHVLVKFDFNQLFPELDAVGGYGRNATTLTLDNNLETVRQGTFPFYYYGVAMTIPLGNSLNRNTYKADKAGLELQLLQIKKLELTIIQSIDNDVANIRSDLPRVDSTRQARMYAEEALKAAQMELQHGSTTSFVVLQDQITLTNDRLAEIQALANYNIDLEQLAFDQGLTLERNHIDLRIR